MSEPAVASLPSRASLVQLRKQSKELLQGARRDDATATARICRHKPGVTDPVLADAQFAIAREYGFASWPSLVHQIEAASVFELKYFEEIAHDFVAAYGADDEALERLNDRFATSKSLQQFREMVKRDRSSQATGGSVDALTLDEARLLVASAFGFEDWVGLVASFTAREADPQTLPHGLSNRPPFYKIDWLKKQIEPRQPLSDRDWERVIDVMRAYGITGLNARGQMTDDALERLSQLDHVTSLNFDGCKRLTDAGLRHLARMPQLVDLNLSGYPGGTITDAGLKSLGRLTALRHFTMCWQSGVSDVGIANLAACDGLELVNLMGTPTGNGAIQALRGKRHLRHFRTGRLVTDVGLAWLHDFPIFKVWQNEALRYDLMTFGDADPNFLMLDGPFTDAGLARLAGLDGLFGLGFFWHVPNLTPEGLGTLSALPNLGALGCEGQLCSDKAMQHIAAIPQLRMLMAQSAVSGDDGFVALSRSPSIEYIWGRDCPNLRGRGFAALTDMRSVKGLAVSCKQVDDAALATLERCRSLKWLLPIDVPNSRFCHIGKCEQLERLTCMYCRDTGDVATEHIIGLCHLTHYYAGQTQITDRSLQLLSQMQSLEVVELSGCTGVSEAGLVQLARLPRLRKVTANATPRVTRNILTAFPSNVQVELWT